MPPVGAGSPDPAPPAEQGAASPRVETRGLAAGWVRFWFTPTDPVGLHAVRLLGGLLLLFWLLTLAGHVDAFFGLRGWFDREAYIQADTLQAEAAAQPEEAERKN